MGRQTTEAFDRAIEAVIRSERMSDGWHYEHDFPHVCSSAELIRDGRPVKEITVEGERHSDRIYDAVADWEIEQEDGR